MSEIQTKIDTLPLLDPVLLNNLFCPVSRKSLSYDRAEQVLISYHAELVYPISHNIPLLVEELAIPLEQFKQQTAPLSSLKVKL